MSEVSFPIKQFIFTLTILGSIIVVGQETNSRWVDHFSYNNIRHILDVNGVIFCSSENGLFSYDPQTQETVKYSKVNELNDVGVTAFTYNPDNQLLFIGYERGEMDILGLEENHNMLEIPLHQSYTGSKRVNHLTTDQHIAIVSGEFGLATFNFENFEFMETTYFTQGGVSFGVKESAIFNGVIYAASDQGVYTHALDEFIANFVSWDQTNSIPTTPYQNIVVFNNNVVASTNNTVYRYDGLNWVSMGFYPNLVDLSVNGNVLSVTQLNQVSNYNESFGLIDSEYFEDELNTGLKIANITYGGSKEKGLLQDSQEIHPDGPYNNLSWSVTPYEGQIWIAPGGMNNFNTALSNADGFYHYNGLEWIHNKSEDMLGAKDILDIEVNPSDTTEIYVSPWFEYVTWEVERIGFLRFNNGHFSENYLENNSIPEGFWRVAGSRFDEEGNLWVAQSYVSTPPKTMLARKNASGNWQSINLGVLGDSGARKPEVYNGYAFVALPRKQGVAVSDMESVYIIDDGSNSGALPSDRVYTAVVDQDGVLWIGTDLGLRILYNPIEAIQSGSFQTEPIIIEQNGLPEALLNDVLIYDIEVDGANRKWIATESSGVYYFSDDGQEEIFHFTLENSPLPSNTVTDVEVDRSTGIVYFATNKGVVAYRSDAVDVGDSFGDVYSYPNPVRPGFNGVVTIKGLPNDADVRIVDIVGNLIFQTKAAGGIAQWDTKNSKGKLVASGIYVVMMTNRDASETKQTKIAIVR